MAYSDELPAGITLYIKALNSSKKLESSVLLPSYDILTGSMKIGQENVAIGNRSVAIGTKTLAGGDQSVAMGNGCTANGINSIAGGNVSIVTPEGQNSVAFGSNTQVKTANSFAFGNNVETSENLDHSQFVIGQYNISDENDLFEIGSGNELERKNAFAVKEDEINNNVSKITFGADKKSYIENNKLVITDIESNTISTADITTTGGTSLSNGAFTIKTIKDEKTGIESQKLDITKDISTKNITAANSNISCAELSSEKLTTTGETKLANNAATFTTDNITLANATTVEGNLAVKGTTTLGTNGAIATFSGDKVTIKQLTEIANDVKITNGKDLIFVNAKNKERSLQGVISTLDSLSSGLAEKISTKDLEVANKITAKTIEMKDELSSITLGSAENTSTSSGSRLLTVYGKVEANRYSARSDRRLKENLREYKSDKSILDLPVYKYDYINGDKNVIGCMAQDLKEICPEIVCENEDGYLSIEESKIVYLLLQEVKKLREVVDELKKKED